MKVKDLLLDKEVTFEKIMRWLIDYKDVFGSTQNWGIRRQDKEASIIASYYHAYKQLLNEISNPFELAKKLDNKYTIYMQEDRPYINGVLWYDVYCRKTDIYDPIPYSFSMAYWGHILMYEIDKISLIRFPKNALAAEILWEMTYDGYELMETAIVNFEENYSDNELTHASFLRHTRSLLRQSRDEYERIKKEEAGKLIDDLKKDYIQQIMKVLRKRAKRQLDG